jgi:putative ABC transport system permease protein
MARTYTEDMVSDIVPARVVNLHRVRALPLLAVALAAALGAILLFYTLAVGARARIRQLAVLRALGMPARRLARVIAYQGVVLALAMCVIGLPIGVVTGVVVWRLVAHQLGVADRPVVGWSTVLLVPLSVLVGLAAARLPSRRVRRQDVASLLHPE